MPKQLIYIVVLLAACALVTRAQQEIPDAPRPQHEGGVYPATVYDFTKPQDWHEKRDHSTRSKIIVIGSITVGGFLIGWFTRPHCDHYPPGYNGHNVPCPRPDADGK